jgi:hypothetical protein
MTTFFLRNRTGNKVSGPGVQPHEGPYGRRFLCAALKVSYELANDL